MYLRLARIVSSKMFSKEAVRNTAAISGIESPSELSSAQR